MLSPQLVRAALAWVVFLVVCSALLLLALDPGTAEFLISAVTLGVGVLLGSLLVFLTRKSWRKS